MSETVRAIVSRATRAWDGDGHDLRVSAAVQCAGPTTHRLVHRSEEDACRERRQDDSEAVVDDCEVRWPIESGLRTLLDLLILPLGSRRSLDASRSRRCGLLVRCRRCLDRRIVGRSCGRL